MSKPKFMLGYDYQWLSEHGDKLPVFAPIGHTIVVGGSGSGKSTSVLYWLYKLKKYNSELYIADFKKSNEFSGITPHFAQFEDCYQLIKDYYEIFLSTPEGGDGTNKIMLIDEIAGLLTYFFMTKEGKGKIEEIKNILLSIMALGRSKLCWFWSSMQRYSASIFPASSGAADNFHILVGLGRLTVDGRKGLFAGEHFDGEDELQYGQGRGIVLIDGQPLKALIIPQVSKKKLLALLQK